MGQAREFLFLNSKDDPLQTKISVNITWHAPQKYWYKLNIDGAYKNGAKNLGLGGVFTDHIGTWIIGFQRQHTTISPLHTELQAIYDGLLLAIKFKLFPLEVETDSTEAINAIQRDHLVCSNIVHACRSLMHQQKDLRFRHNFRKGNHVAHLRTKDATINNFKQFSLDNPKLHAIPPLFVKQQLTMEQNGACLFAKSLPTTACNMLRTLGNQNIACDNPSMCGNFSTTCNKVNDF
ncbi:uncharacterized protein LOC142177427 [Nicotiana tabacum]|uniref:Uncharacterized protein LOC142177427 n=1 Tax=Nicotiana tabacum TaxID=4097 RepID=A0AC58TXY9_TOBAC